MLFSVNGFREEMKLKLQNFTSQKARHQSNEQFQ